MEIYGKIKNRKTNTDEYYCNDIYRLIDICENFENEQKDIKKLYQIELLFTLTDEYFKISDFQKEYNIKNVSEGLKKITEKYPKKIEEIKNINMQLKAIYDIDENEFTQEIIELAEELLSNKV